MNSEKAPLYLKKLIVTVFITVVIAVVYMMLGKLGLLLAITNAGGNVTLVWPPTGMAFFAVYLLSYRAWPGLALGALALNIANESSLQFALATAVGNPLPAVLAYYLLRRFFKFDHRLSRPSDVFKFVFVGCIATTLVSAFIGTSALVWDGTISLEIYFTVFASWWAGDSIGVLLFAPLLLTFNQWRDIDWNSNRVLELSVLAILAIVLGCFVLTDLSGFNKAGQGTTASITLYLMFPVCIWVAMRFWQIGAAVFTLIFMVFAIYGSVGGSGPFVLSDPYLTLFHMNMFLAALMVVSLTLAATASSLQFVQQKLTKEAVKESEARFRDFSDISADWLWETDTELRFSYLSARYEQITGDSITDRLGTSILELQSPTDVIDNWFDFKGSLEERRPFKDFEFTLAVSNNKVLYLSSNGIPVFNAAASFIGYRGSVTDITERKQAEIALLESGQRISRFNKLLTEIVNQQDFVSGDFQAFLDSITELLSEVLNVTRVSVWRLDNAASAIECQNLWDADEQKHSKGTLLYEKDLPSYFRALKKDRTLVINNVFEDPRTQELSTEYFPQFGIESMLNAPFHASGAIVGVLCLEQTKQRRIWKIEEESLIISITDILSIAFESSHRKELEETLRHAQKMDAVGQLTGGVAHEYNNMLGVILGYAELLDVELSEDPKLVKYVHAISHAGQRGAKLTKKLLAFSQQRNDDIESLDINVLLRDQQQMLEKTLTVRIQLKFELADEL